MIVHGIPNESVILEEGDIISVDCGAIIEGYHGDAAYTTGVGEISKEAMRLIEVCEQSLFAGIEQLRPGNRLHEVGRAVQDVAEERGFFGGAGVCGPCHRHRDARRAPGAQLLAGDARGRPSRRTWCSRSNPWSMRSPRDRPARRRMERGDRRRATCPRTSSTPLR